MRIITWNINSVRLRIGLVERVLETYRPDILCLQETKTPDEHFPLEAIQAAGYAHVHFHGMKGYNGVAILSKLPFEATDIHHRCGKEDCRHISARFTMPTKKVPPLLREGVRGRVSDVEGFSEIQHPRPSPPPVGGGNKRVEYFDLHNLYIPAGGDEPDPDINEKYKHKLEFVEEMTAWFKDTYSSHDPVIALGDFNIAPYEHDVWSHKQLLNVVSHTPPETERLGGMLASLDWVDTARHFIPMAEKTYSWWSYRNRDWRASNRGRRLDHIWVTRPLQGSLQSYDALMDLRDGEKPSDHVPVMIDLDL